MGQCLSTPSGDGGQQWQVTGLSPFDAGARYGGLEPGKQGCGYSTTADVGLKPAQDKPQFGFMHDKPAPTPLQLERIDEDATLQGDASPLKPAAMQALEGSGGSATAGASTSVHVQRKPISWTKGELVGQGAFGSVFVAMDNDTGELIAVKQVHVPRGGGAHAKKVEENIRMVEEEVQLLQQFDHPNIVRYLGTEKTSESLNIFLEYVPGGSIASLLAKFGSFKESVVKVYTKQILMGLEYLHSKGVMHRDIKGANILVDNTGLVKLADFGASKKLEDLVTVADGNKSVRGTPYWMAPEVITQTGHGRQADLWSVACTVLEMATGRPPWSVQYPSQVAAMFHIASSKGPPEIPQHLSPECKDFLYLCFNRDWKARPLASTLLRHPFLADVPVRSQGPPPTAAALVQAWHGPRRSTGVPAPDAGDSQFGTPSPLNPKLAGMSGGAARISVQTTEGSMAGGEGATLSPLGQYAGVRRPQWDSAATSAQQQPQQQPQQQAVSREVSAVGRVGGSPTKRPALSLRASAPVLSGYASVALSQQSDRDALLRSARHAAPAQAGQELGISAALRGSRESGLSSHGPPAASAAPADGDEQQAVRQGNSSERQIDEDAAAQSPVSQAADKPAQQEDPPVAEEQAPSPGVPSADAGETPAALRQRSRAQDLLQAEEAQAGGSPAAPPDSAKNSSGTNKSDYNPMEEPSWLHANESPLPGEGTPTSALTGGASPPRLGTGVATSLEATSFAAAADVAAAQEGHAAAVEAAPSAAGMAAASVAAAPAAAGRDQHPSADHIVWTNDDGDIDALPWDMGGWSTGSSAEQATPGGQQEREQQPEPHEGQEEGAQEAHLVKAPVDEDELIGALRRKAQHDVRASMALFEKSVNIPAVHAPASPKPAAADGGSPRTIAAFRAMPPALAHVPACPAPGQPGLAAESIESLGTARHQHFPLQPAAAGGAGAAASNESRRRATAVQNLLSGVRPTATGAPPPPSPLQAAVGGLAELGYSSSGTGASAYDRESIWQQELSQELFRVKGAAAAGGTAAAAGRRVSMHGSPLKSRMHGLH